MSSVLKSSRASQWNRVAAFCWTTEQFCEPRNQTWSQQFWLSCFKFLSLIWLRRDEAVFMFTLDVCETKHQCSQRMFLSESQKKTDVQTGTLLTLFCSGQWMSPDALWPDGPIRPQDCVVTDRWCHFVEPRGLFCCINTSPHKRHHILIFIILLILITSDSVLAFNVRSRDTFIHIVKDKLLSPGSWLQTHLSRSRLQPRWYWLRLYNVRSLQDTNTRVRTSHPDNNTAALGADATWRCRSDRSNSRRWRCSRSWVSSLLSSRRTRWSFLLHDFLPSNLKQHQTQRWLTVPSDSSVCAKLG